MSRPLTAWIDGVGLIAPGLADWTVGSDVLAGHQSHSAAPSVLPAPALLPPGVLLTLDGPGDQVALERFGRWPIHHLSSSITLISA